MKNPLSYVRIVIASLALTASIPSFAANTSSTTCPSQININQADENQLSQCLSHIGERTAKSIVSYRNTHGNFKDIKDLALVKGVGEKRAQALAPHLTVK